MAWAPPPSAAKLYRPNTFVSLPAELDPATYDTSPEKLRAEAERLAIRSRLKRQYLLQLNDPNVPAVIVSGDGGAEGRRGKRGARPPHPAGPGAGPAPGAGAAGRCPPSP